MGYWLLFLSHCFLLVIFPSCTCSMMPLCNHDEASALLQFKSSLNTSSSSIFFRDCPMHSLSNPNIKSWKNGTNCCLWDGVSCDTKSGHVIGLDLSCGFLQGKLNPNSTLFHLTHVQKLNLAFNDFSNSQLSSQLSLSNLKNLTHLDLSYNNFEGPVPLGLENITGLTYLNLQSNSFSGEIPNFFKMLSKLENLYLSNNHFEGNIPNSIFDMQNLLVLDLSSNKLIYRENFHKGCNSSLLNLYSLSLSSLNLNSFPKFIQCLEDLASLDLSNNKIHGKIPNWFNTGGGSLTYLDLSHNLLTSAGHLSSSLSNVELEYINLSFNMLEGEIPIPPFANIFFSMSNNKLSGNLSSRICDACWLELLDLSHNNLTGQLPECIGTFQSLAVMDLQGNNLVGTIPQTYFDLQFLETMNLRGNQLKGSLPHGMPKCKQVRVLDLGENNIEGSFPSWLESLPELQVLILRGNRFNGTITNMEANHTFPKLRVFDVSNNNFSGTLPTTYIKNFKGMVMNVNNGSLYMNNYIYNALFTYHDSLIVTIKGLNYELKRILTTFTSLDLSNNRFEGHIPTIIGELKSLKGLNLSHNKIIGSIPQSFGDLENLEWLDLSSNKLTGEIPDTLTNLYSLSVLNLSQNHLEGIIPRGNQFNTFQNESYKGNSGLCGLPLSKQCHGDEDEPIDSTPVQDEEEFLFGWKAVAIGYASGAVIGILLGCVMFLIEKPLWVIRFVQDIGNQIVKRKRN